MGFNKFRKPLMRFSQPISFLDPFQKRFYLSLQKGPMGAPLEAEVENPSVESSQPKDFQKVFYGKPFKDSWCRRSLIPNVKELAVGINE